MYSGGSGTLLDPYLIANKTDLKDIESNMSSYFKLTADIDCDGSFEPIGYEGGTGYTSFTGSLDGDGYTISNIVGDYVGSGNYYIGIFAHGNGCQISNLNIDNVSYKGIRYVGALIGNFHTSSLGYIKNIVMSDLTVEATSYYAGGLAGVVDLDSGGYIRGVSITTVSAVSDNSAGGLIGMYISTDGTNAISDCVIYSPQIIAVDYYAGGLIGRAYSSSIVDRCAVIGGSVLGHRIYTGGLIGHNGIDIQDCYTTCSVKGTYDSGFVGGITGYNYSGGVITRCYTTGNIEGLDYGGGIAGYNVGTISNSYALNSIIIRTSGNSVRFGRIAVNVGTISDCYALDTMVFQY